MISRKRLLCMIVLLATIEQALAYKSGCSGGYCFILSENKNGETKTQSDAQRWCSNNGNQLIEIQNMDIQSALVDFINSLGLSNTGIVTNGKREYTSGWSRVNGRDIGSIVINGQTYWLTLFYGYLKSASSVFDVYASTPTDIKESYICSGSQLDCTNDGVLIDGQCYKSFNEWLSWYDARNRCLKLGGDLASFDSITTNAGFNALNGSWLNPSKQYWIGFRNEQWKWTTSNVDVRYSQWAGGHPKTFLFDPFDCLCLSPNDNYKWIECRCSQFYHTYQFLCISGATTTTISVKADDTTVLLLNKPTPVTTKSSRNETKQKDSPDLISAVTPAKIITENDLRIPLGVGLGVGLGVIFIIVIIAVVIILFRRRGCPRNRTEIPSRKPSLSSEDVTLHSSELHYAAVQKLPAEEIMTAESEASASENSTRAEYAELDLSSKQNPSLASPLTYPDGKGQLRDTFNSMGNRDTLRPPACIQTNPNHVLINGDEYATVTRND